MSDPGNVASADNTASHFQNPESILPAANPNIIGSNRLSRPSHLRGLLLLGIVFIIVVSGIGFGFYALLKNNQTAGSSETGLARAITSSKPIFADNLSSNIIGLWDSDKTACVFKGGTYHVLVSTADTVNGCGEQKFTIDNFAIEVDVSLLSGNNAGVYFRYNSSKDIYYLFSITRQGEFFFAVMHGQTPYAIISPTKTTAISAGNARNTLLVTGKGSDFKFFINGVFVGEAQNNIIPSGFMGFFVQTSKAETSGEASFSNLKMFSATALSSTS